MKITIKYPGASPFFLAAFLLSSLLIQAQDCPMQVQKNAICYEGIIQTGDNTDQGELFQRSLLWIAESFINTPLYTPVQLSSKEQGIIVLHISLDEHLQMYKNAHCKLTLQFREGKCKYRFYNFMLTYAYYDNSNSIEYTKEIYSHYTMNADNILQQEKYGKEYHLVTLMKQLDQQVKNYITGLQATLKRPILDDF